MIVLAAGLLITSTFLYDYYNRSQVAQLKEELSMVADTVNRIGADYFEYFDSSMFRFTLVSADGTVLYDLQADAENMENHLTREEIREALADGEGSSARYSSTLTEQTFYEAIRLKSGQILRISVNQLTVAALLLGILPVIVAIVLVSVVAAFILSHRMTRSIVKPLGKLDLDHPAENDTYEELIPILTKLNKQHKQIVRQMNELRRKSDEFEQITASMNEGLILLDEHKTILSINAAAKALFGADDSVVGCNLLALDRSPDMIRAVNNALNGKKAELHEERNGREYQFIINRTASNGMTVGIVILCLDVTETAFAERNRKEFTANVSHELKTPLQSIIGSAELLENDLVKPEDTKRFVGNIKNEAARLVSLINDIIRLSQLDERSEPLTEKVNLRDVAEEVVEALSASAARRGVALCLNAESCVMSGVRRYLYEILYNLCDNAIRYNVDGGRVTINVKANGESVRLTVSDTGIGIPAEHRSRIFERFYRVDKSHSKETGGTGLGLSIVKHAVAYHDGTLRLDSKVGEGTTITVEFR